MGFAVWATARVIIPMPGHSTLYLLSGLLATIAVGCVSYGALSYFARIPEFEMVLKLIKKRGDKQKTPVDAC